MDSARRFLKTEVFGRKKNDQIYWQTNSADDTCSTARCDIDLRYSVPGSGDPAQIMLGSTASEYELAEMREQLGLNRPFIVQLGEFLSDVFLHFDLGESYLTS
ncbi:MAG: hypothetical protein ACLUAR_06995 [Pilosibacter sp.]